MKYTTIKIIPILTISGLLFGCENDPVEEIKLDENINIITQSKGAKLGFSNSSGTKILDENGLKFKDLNKNGKVDRYEDWRLSFEKRATDLASQMSLE